MIEITLLRHGQSQGNLEDRMQGQADFPLTELGVEQARQLGRYWQTCGTHFDRIISSPLQRAQRTAAEISAALSAPIELDPAWMEQDFGELNGSQQAKLNQLDFPLEFRRPYEAVGGGESLVGLHARASLAVQSLVQRPGGSYLVVTHGGILNRVLYAILGLAPVSRSHGPRFRFGNTGFARLSYLPEQAQWRMLSLDEHPHLEQN